MDSLRVVVGYACNYRCAFCYQRRRDGRFLALERLEAVLDARPELAPGFVTVMGGEPTLSPGLLRLVERLRARFPSALLSLTSNGSAPAELYLAVDERGVDNLTFSLPTLDAGRYPVLTGQRLTSLDEYLARMLEVRGRARATVRVNAYVLPDQACAIFAFCKAHGLRLTFCEDLVSGAAAAAQRLELPARLVVDHPLRRIYRDADGFEVWNYKHVESFDYDNLVVLPDGSTTLDFADVLAGRG